MRELTNREIDLKLTLLPHQIWRNEQQATNMWAELERAKAAYQYELNDHFLKGKAVNKSLTVRELEATAFNASFNARLNVINKEASLKATKILAERDERERSGLQSIIRLRVAEIQSIEK